MDFSSPFFHVLYIINLVFVVALTVCYSNQAIYMLLSVFMKRKRWKKTDKLHKYAVLISARNEENVIGQLLDSLHAQDYPKELLDIFVVADNCTDQTAAVATEKGAIVFERFNQKERGKSYAMDYAFKRILAEYGDRGYEAFFLFDADNIVPPGFVREMNNTFDCGREVVAGYRNTKNFSDSWESGSSCYMYMREQRQMHFCRSTLDIGSFISGTGCLISSRFVREFGGWPFHTLTEDVEFSAYMATIGKKIAFNSDAMFYDEQPSDFKTLWNQRLRWCKGNHQVFAKRGAALAASLLRRPSLTKWGMLVHIMPLPAITFIWFILYMLLGVVWAAFHPMPFQVFWTEFFQFSLSNFVVPYLLAFVDGLLLFLECYHEINASFSKKFLYMLVYPVGMYLFVPITAWALFASVEWKDIRHHPLKK